MVTLPLLNTPYSQLYKDVPTIDEVQGRTGGLPNNVNGKTRSRKQKLMYDLLGLLGIFTLVFLFYMILEPPVLYFRLDDTSLMYPFIPSNVSSALVALLSILLPVFAIILFHIFFAWNKWDLVAGLYGAFLAYALSILITSTLWYFVGGLRPHFLTICKPDQNIISTWREHPFYTTSVCSERSQFTRDTFHGFPSGHASTSFAGCVFLSTYLAAHLRLYRNGNCFKLLLVILPLICAIWLATSRIVDHHHNPFQIFVGILIGIFSALYAYRLTFLDGFLFGYGKYAHVCYLHYGNPG